MLLQKEIELFIPEIFFKIIFDLCLIKVPKESFIT